MRSRSGAGGLPAISTAADEKLIGGSVECLLVFAREQHPEFAAMRSEADAAAERLGPAGAHWPREV
ncbi:MAG: hypothetical protein QMD17_11940 [Rhodocyclaceae bacterium]|nr:hypothetical protein [Rhodocyclaceae bacterium]